MINESAHSERLIRIGRSEGYSAGYIAGRRDAIFDLVTYGVIAVLVGLAVLAIYLARSA